MNTLLRAILLAAWFLAPQAMADDPPPAIAADAITALDQALAATAGESSPARKRLGIRRVIRDATELVETQPAAPNRFEVLSIAFRGQQQLFGIDNSSANREALLETAKRLAEAPDEFAVARLDADLLLTQAAIAREGADAHTRARALMPLVERYRDTPAEARLLRTAMVIALELGDNRIVEELRETISNRFASDLEMISFLRDKLGGQVFGAPFSGTFERSDGRFMRFPMDALGRSAILYFWTKEDLSDAQAFAAGWKEIQSEVDGRLVIFSFNLDDLPDAGESILRDLGVDWPAIKFPGGREHPHYQAFVREDPRRITLSPTGNAAILMAGTTRKTSGTEEAPDFSRYFQSTLARSWTRPRYVTQVCSILSGDFLVINPAAPFDPARPPELQAICPKTTLPRTPASVPEATLAAIQECFLAPPLRYRADIAELRTRYRNADALCREAIEAHPAAPDLWIVRNRRIIALLNLWKLESNLDHFEQAVAESQFVLASNLPAGTEVIARFCLARNTLRQPDNDEPTIIREFLDSAGGETNGPALAAALILAIDVADRPLRRHFRESILKNHTENPMMWTATAFLLDRYQQYWLDQEPFTAGWSYGRRENHYMSLGDPEDARRDLTAEFQSLDGKPFRIPQDTSGKWTVLAFVTPWEDPQASPFNELSRYVGAFIKGRPEDDVRCIIAVLDGDSDPIRAHLTEAQATEFTVVTVPGGSTHPIVARLGINNEDQRMNIAVLRPDGTIAAVASGLAMQLGGSRQIPQHVIEWHDERAVTDALERGDLDAAKQLIFQLAPPFDPEAVDEKGHKLKKPQLGTAHLSARAHVYAAMGEWDLAMADAEELLSRHISTAGGMSMRTPALDKAEALRASIREQIQRNPASE